MLSEAASRAVLRSAIDQAGREGSLQVPDEAAHWPGFRRRVRQEIAGWSQQERPLDSGPPDADDPVAADAWAIHLRYRRALASFGAVDRDGLAVWASTALKLSPPKDLKRFGVVTVLDFDDETPAIRRALLALETRAKAVRISLPVLTDPALEHSQGRAPALRLRLLDRGYAESVVEEPLYRPRGLREIERRLFREGAHQQAPWTTAAGLFFLGAPQGEGVGLLVARELARALDSGVPPEEILVLFRSWDEDAEAVLRVARSWGLPVAPLGRPRKLATDPAVSALRLALAAAPEDAETEPLVRLLRHGRFLPDWQGLRAPNLSATAAATVLESRAFRGHDLLRRALGRLLKSAGQGSKAPRPLTDEVLGLVDRLLQELQALNRPGTFAEHVGRLGGLSANLGLDRDPGPEGNVQLDRLWEALDEHAAALEALGQGAEPRELHQFTREFQALTDDLESVVDHIYPNTTMFSIVDYVKGVRARLVVLANLAEGTFPSRGPLSLERARFARVAGMAEEQLILAYPTRDAKGQELLAAGFLDDLRRAIDPETLAKVQERHDRLDPALIDHEDLARSPADARVRAVALAFQRRDDGPLKRLAADPHHRSALEGTAAALLLRHHRVNGREFTEFEGGLSDPRARRMIARDFGSDRPFTASQLESYLYCPFQYFMRYVLGLEPLDDRDELGEDFRGRGTRIHDFLERLERRTADGESDREAIARAMIAALIEEEPRDHSEVDSGRYLIDTRRLERAVNAYLQQALQYESQGDGPPPRPTHLEVKFGMEDAEYPCLEIGQGRAAVKIRGAIDRIDVVESADRIQYRVIDYKTGKVPTRGEIESFDKLQLPVYALAAERLVLGGLGATFDEVGYWGLADKGYGKAEINWAELYRPLEEKILGAVDRLREGRFVVQPRTEDCTRKCDFSAVCRIGQVRLARKGEPEGAESP